MKKLILAASILFCTALTITSCNNGDYDADPNTDNSGIPNPIPPDDGGGNGGGSGGGNSSFNWTGTDPMSAKIDGVAFQATSGLANAANGYIVIQGSAGLDGTVMLSFPENTGAGTVVSITSTNPASYMSGTFDIFNTAAGGSGSIKVTENDATHVKGYFYFTAKNAAGANSVTISDGYFNINK
jgi:hypothetical protein